MSKFEAADFPGVATDFAVPAAPSLATRISAEPNDDVILDTKNEQNYYNESRHQTSHSEGTVRPAARSCNAFRR